jgi:hypothetical protein
MPYAERTKVNVFETRSEIEKMLTKAGATAFANATEDGRAMIQFKMKDRIIRFNLPLPKSPGAQASTRERNVHEQKMRQRWRGLLLTIKAKLESIESGIEQFEVAFLAQIVMPGNVTVEQMALPAVAEAYKSGKAPAMLLEWNR